jgi:CBS domain-containing protein
MGTNGVVSPEVLSALAQEDHSALRLALSAVRDLMTKEVVTLTPDAPVQDAISSFAEHRFRHLLVAEAGRVVGVLSDRDVLRFLARNPGAGETPVAQVMTKTPIAIQPRASISDAIRLILHNRINCLPVVAEDGMVQGILTTTDLLRALFAVQSWLERRASDIQK